MNAVVTVCIGDLYAELASISHPTMRAYAERIGADFVVIDEGKLSIPHFEKFQMRDLLLKYDRVIYLDGDLIVRDDCPDLFEIVPENMVGAFNEAPFRDHSSHIVDASHTYNIGLEKDYDGSYYNTGVMVASRLHRDMFALPVVQSVFNHYDQSYLNLFIQKNHVKMYRLSHHFNRMVLMDDVTGEHRLNSYIIHYAGILQKPAAIMARDLGMWNQGIREVPRKATLAVGAKLGDMVCAEPVIRYMIQHEYRGWEVTVMTVEPEMFAHLADFHNVKLATFGAPRREDDCRVIKNCMIPQESPIWRFITPSAMNTTDWMAINCLRHTLPDADKRIVLRPSLRGFAEVLEVLGGQAKVEDLILIHPGRGWPSKTFPPSFWQEVCDKLIQANHKVALIGKTIDEDVGFVEFEAPDGVIDFRDLLDTMGLIALISKAKTLVSNDSAPIHIAGAFDNGIVLIPTCKHPDHVLPYRLRGKYDKAIVAYGKEKMWEYPCKNPMSLYGFDMESVPGGNIEPFLPSIDEVLEAVENI